MITVFMMNIITVMVTIMMIIMVKTIMMMAVMMTITRSLVAIHCRDDKKR